ncbi:hypothetical protein GCM10022226_53980 [Sphaerisporangium flaviroseum]|uniref:Uncharacterized protein n=1 Tax=Sphaerisporangium flaviroseum TaxID=509199 RepID=A0ABP7ITR7_9ACTN
MSGATAADYAWFEEEFGDSLCVSGFCLTFVRDVSPEEALHRIGVTAEQAKDVHKIPAEHLVTAYAVIGGTVLLEEEGYAGTLVEVTRRLSAGTIMAAVYHDGNLDRQFLYSADGHLITGFAPDGPGARWGGDPDRLVVQMRQLGMPTAGSLRDDDHERADPLLTALALAERATGVRLTRDHLTGPALMGSAEHLY